MLMSWLCIAVLSATCAVTYSQCWYQGYFFQAARSICGCHKGKKKWAHSNLSPVFHASALTLGPPTVSSSSAPPVSSTTTSPATAAPHANPHQTKSLQRPLGSRRLILVKLKAKKEARWKTIEAQR